MYRSAQGKLNVQLGEKGASSRLGGRIFSSMQMKDFINYKFDEIIQQKAPPPPPPSHQFIPPEPVWALSAWGLTVILGPARL